ncbi:HD domain-containing protein [Mycolicibacterium goodii]|uniref:HD domain-containing protein n=2 Tax=Mycolicibacterium goodii TaxID=134601 RepID=A0ABS6HMU7_MYCGD|nr:HD domain-containing protein [Mycolicibacterium goodii]OKH68975.1 phosphohydrolase [Mycobacterium sp. SWH-M5]MBU8815580.1 HD domain-containing protein [Mycolicibacterium goodii]MBU8823014.1 HD domain-containing protein [Mycolicibacterium goodii]MBU8839812.1 HD domain-containing protein [Mycolicibacterium goodii]PJK22830.1 HD domain-containing protein [Mycolicibacterium goodii]
MMPLPASRLVDDAAEHIRAVVHPEIYRHSLRTYLLGMEAARRDGVTDIDEESLCVAALFHDSGTAPVYNGPARFEIESADAAARFLRAYGWTPAKVDAIWEAIALHTTPEIPDRRGMIARYVRMGVQIEFGSTKLRESFADAIEAAEYKYPRQRVEEVLQGLVIDQALARPQKASPPSWAADLVRHHRPGQQGINPAF